MVPTLYYGGTFDPLHFGHLKPTVDLAEKVKANSLTFLPCHIPPHKTTTTTSSEHRLAMLQLGISDYQKKTQVKLNVSDYEITRGGNSYTRLTVEHFSHQSPDQQIGFVIGMDSLLSFTSWFKWQEILEFCHLYVMQRPGYHLNKSVLHPALADLLGIKVHLVETAQVDVSSSQIRKQLKLGTEKARQYVPNDVMAYIKQHSLY